MNGNRFFFDTNAIIAYLGGNTNIQEAIANASWIGTSVITVIEFLSFSELSNNDLLLFNIFLNRIEVIGISNNLGFLEALAIFKLESKLKLPDALIAGHAMQLQATLIFNDKHFQNINKLSVLRF